MSFNEEMRKELAKSKTATGKALEEAMVRILENPKIFVFGEFLCLSNFQAAAPRHLATMKLFAFDDYITYVGQRANYIALTPAMVRKLKMITITQLADTHRENLQKSKAGQKSALAYSDIMKAIEI